MFSSFLYISMLLKWFYVWKIFDSDYNLWVVPAGALRKCIWREWFRERKEEGGRVTKLFCSAKFAKFSRIINSKLSVSQCRDSWTSYCALYQCTLPVGSILVVHFRIFCVASRLKWLSLLSSCHSRHTTPRKSHPKYLY